MPDQWLNRTTNGPPPPAPHPTAPLLPGNGLGETVQSDPDDSVALNYISSGQCLMDFEEILSKHELL